MLGLRNSGRQGDGVTQPDTRLRDLRCPGTIALLFCWTVIKVSLFFLTLSSHFFLMLWPKKHLGFETLCFVKTLDGTVAPFLNETKKGPCKRQRNNKNHCVIRPTPSGCRFGGRMRMLNCNLQLYKGWSARTEMDDNYNEVRLLVLMSTEFPTLRSVKVAVLLCMISWHIHQ